MSEYLIDNRFSNQNKLEFKGYRVTPVFFGNGRPIKGSTGKTEHTSIEKARVEAVNLIKRNPDIYTKGFIEEWYVHLYTGTVIEKVYQEIDSKTNRKSYWLIKENNRKEIFRINPTTGKITKTVKKKK